MGMNITKGLAFFAIWFFVGSTVTVWTTDLFIMASMGGVFEPPVIWSIARDFGVVMLPFLLIFGGVPASIQLMRGHPWVTNAILAFAICVTTWLGLMFLVIWGPPIWGWTW